MVRLADDGEARFSQPFDQPHLPKRLVPIERLREQAADQLLQLGFSARRRQSGVAHVVLEVELGLVDPDRPALLERNEHHALPVARDLLQPRLDQREEVPIRRRWALENGHRADVHMGAAILDFQEQRIEGAEALVPGIHALARLIGERTCCRRPLPDACSSP